MEGQYLGVQVSDNFRPPYRASLGSVFDAIVCDPPYGIREPTERVGTVDDKDPRYPLPEEKALVHFPKKVHILKSFLFMLFKRAWAACIFPPMHALAMFNQSP